MGARVVTDQVQMVPSRGCNAEGLLHQAVWLVPIAVRTFFSGRVHVGLAAVSAIWRSPGSSERCDWRGISIASTTALTFHLPVGQEAARDSAGTP